MPFEKGNKYAPKKGEVRNPKGRPKGSISLNDILRKLLKGKDPETQKKMAEVVTEKILQEALKGDKDFNSRLLIEMWEMMDGKPPQAVNLDANVRQRGEMIVIDATGKLDDDESPMDDEDVTDEDSSES